MHHPHGDRPGHRHGAGAGYRFSPNEIAVLGEAGAGKTTLIAALLDELSAGRRVAYLREGSLPAGTQEPAAHGAALAAAVDAEGRLRVAGGGIGEWNARTLLGEAEVVIVEGERPSQMAALLVADETGRLPDPLPGAALAVAVRDGLPSQTIRRVRRVAGEVPLFTASDTAALAAHLIARLAERARSVPFYGLVLGGGRSTRMKRDKGALAYHGVPQLRFAHSLLSPLCDRVFVSTRFEQAADPLFEGLEQIHDRFVGFGPMGGMLSAMHAHPQAAWLVLGCDLPFVDEATLRELVRQRDPLLPATCYLSAHDGLPEPLCAIYEPRYLRRLHQFLAEGRDCPRKALINTRVKRIPLDNPSALDNINDPEEYEIAAAKIREEEARVR